MEEDIDEELNSLLKAHRYKKFHRDVRRINTDNTQGNMHTHKRFKHKIKV